MLTYPVDKQEITDLLTTFLRERMQLDRFLDDNLKKKLIFDRSNFPKKLIQMQVVSEADRQINALRHTEGIVFADSEKELAEASFEEGYRAEYLTETKLGRIPKSRRVAMARSMLEIFIRLNEEKIYPGIINLNALVTDGSDTSDSVYLSRVTRFQLGRFRQSWEEIADEKYSEDNSALGAWFPFFDEVCQNIAYARLLARIVRDERLTAELESPEVFSPEDLLETLNDMAPEILKPRIKKIGVWVISSDALSSMDSLRYSEEIALLNTILLSASANTEESPLYINYYWCGRESDLRGGSGAVCSTGMRRFDGTYIPYVPYYKPRRSEEVITGKNMLKAFVSAEYELSRSDFDKKLLVLLAPRETDNNISRAIEICLNSEISDRFLVLFDQKCNWTTTGEGTHLLNTSNPSDLNTLYSRICSIVGAEKVS